MIKNLFLPEKIGSYQLFAKRVVGFDIGRTSIHATIVTVQGYTSTIENLIEEPIEPNAMISYDERVTIALKNMAPKIGSYDALYTALSSSLIVFKELSLPLMGLSKLKMVVPFEVESMLPFSLDSAVIDAIVTKEDLETKKADVLVAAVKKDQIAQHLALFENAGLSVDKITVDMFELYGLYKSIPTYANYQGLVSLIDIGAYTSRLAIIIDGQLKYIRSINKGILTAAKRLQEYTRQDVKENVDHFLRFGTVGSDDEKYNQAAIEASHELINDLHFSIDAYVKKISGSHKIQHVIVTGLGSEVPGIPQLLKESFGGETEVLYGKKVIHNGVVASKVTQLPGSFLVSLATALSSTITQDFDLQKLHTHEKSDSLLSKQIITAGALLGALFVCFSLISFFKLRNVKAAYNASQAEAVKKIKEAFPDIKNKTLLSAKNEASSKLKAAQNKWAPLFYKNRSSFLKYLYELSRHINKKETGLDLSSIDMDQNEIRLSGTVRNIEAVKKLEEELKSELYTLEDPLQVTDFKTRPIRLKINKNI